LPGLESHGFGSSVTVAVISTAVKVEMFCDDKDKFAVARRAPPSAKKKGPCSSLADAGVSRHISSQIVPIIRSQLLRRDHKSHRQSRIHLGSQHREKSADAFRPASKSFPVLEARVRLEIQLITSQFGPLQVKKTSLLNLCSKKSMAAKGAGPKNKAGRFEEEQKPKPGHDWSTRPPSRQPRARTKETLNG
jgi:hypothetical protein